MSVSLQVFFLSSCCYFFAKTLWLFFYITCFSFLFCFTSCSCLISSVMLSNSWEGVVGTWSCIITRSHVDSEIGGDMKCWNGSKFENFNELLLLERLLTAKIWILKVNFWILKNISWNSKCCTKLRKLIINIHFH